MPQLDWTTYPSELFWLLVIFCGFWAGMAFFALTPLQIILKRRRTLFKTLEEEATVFLNKGTTLKQENAYQLQKVREKCELAVEERKAALENTLKQAHQKTQEENRIFLQEMSQKMLNLKHEVLEDSQAFLPELETLLLKSLEQNYRVSPENE